MTEAATAKSSGDGQDRLIRRTAVTVALLSAATALTGLVVTESGNRALRDKSIAIDRKTEAVRWWSEHQAVRTKANILALSARLQGKSADVREKADRYRRDIAATRQKAIDLETAAERADDRSERLLEPRLWFIMALVLFQVSAGLGSITILAKSNWMFRVTLVGAGLGVFFVGLGGVVILLQ